MSYATITITPPDTTQGETPYFLTMFINNQKISAELEATCHSGEITVTAHDALWYYDLEKITRAFLDSINAEDAPEMHADAFLLFGDLNEYISAEYAPHS
jgi:hypothetical protein